MIKYNVFRKGLVIGIFIVFIVTIFVPNINGYVQINNWELSNAAIINNQNLGEFEKINYDLFSYTEKELLNLTPDILNLDQELKSDFMPGELIVKFKKDVSLNFSINEEKFIKTGLKSVDELNKKFSVIHSEKLSNLSLNHYLSNIYIFTMPEDVDILKVAKEFTKNTNIKYAEPNYMYYYSDVTNDPFCNVQWPLNNVGQDYPNGQNNNPSPGNYDCDIDAFEAWETEQGREDIVVAVIDSGVDHTHFDIADNIWINEEEDINHNGKFDNWLWWRKKNGVSGDIDNEDNDDNGYIDDVIGWDFCSKSIFFNSTDNDPMDENGHGTHCAGIVAAVTNNNVGIAGVSWNSKIMPVKILNKRGAANLLGAVRGIIYAVDNGADIISMSWIGPSSNTLKNVLNHAYNNGVILVAAAGNEPNDLGFLNYYPACHEKVITVAATNSMDENAPFTSFGNPVDVAAPGVDILSLRAKNCFKSRSDYIYKDHYFIASGTSMACPHVAGVAALMVSQNPNLTPKEVKTILRSSTDKVNSSSYIGVGRVNANKALQKLYSVIADLNVSSKVDEESGLVIINGTAKGEGFIKYIIEYNKGTYPETWIEIYNSSEEIDDNILGIFNTTNLKDGIYTIRLKVICDHGAFEDQKQFFLNRISETIYVDDDGGKDYKSIREALNNAGDGDTIYVYDGIYNEDLVINKNIDLIGHNNKTTIINCYQIGIRIYGLKDRINISGFTIAGSGKSQSMGISLEYPTNVSLFDNIIQNHTFGIFCNIGFDINISNNIIINNFIGILSMGFNSSIQNNKINQNTIGLYLLYNVNVEILRNQIGKNNIGILVTYLSLLNKIQYNNIYNNKIVGLYLRGKSNLNQINYNNFIKNTISASFKGCIMNDWSNNFWKRSRLLPKPIFGRQRRFIPWVNFDWNPAKEPYDIQSI